jgi:hypothetical protein
METKGGVLLFVINSHHGTGFLVPVEIRPDIGTALAVGGADELGHRWSGINGSLRSSSKDCPSNLGSRKRKRHRIVPDQCDQAPLLIVKKLRLGGGARSRRPPRPTGGGAVFHWIRVESFPGGDNVTLAKIARARA